MGVEVFAAMRLVQEFDTEQGMTVRVPNPEQGIVGFIPVFESEEKAREVYEGCDVVMIGMADE